MSRFWLRSYQLSRFCAQWVCRWVGKICLNHGQVDGNSRAWLQGYASSSWPSPSQPGVPATCHQEGWGKALLTLSGCRSQQSTHLNTFRISANNSETTACFQLETISWSHPCQSRTVYLLLWLNMKKTWNHMRFGHITNFCYMYMYPCCVLHVLQHPPILQLSVVLSSTHTILYLTSPASFIPPASLCSSTSSRATEATWVTLSVHPGSFLCVLCK